MTNNIVVTTFSDNESIGSNDEYNNSVIVPTAESDDDSDWSSVDSACSSIKHKLSPNLIATLVKQYSRRKVTTLSSLPTLLSQLKASKKTATAVVLSSKPAGLQINSNVAGSGARQRPVGVTFIPPHGVESRPNHYVGLTFSKPYAEGNTAFNTYGVTCSNPFAAINGAQNPLSGTFSQTYRVDSHRRYHPYRRLTNIRHNHHSSKRTMDFISQMEASSSTQRQVPRKIPSNEALAEWGAMLSLGNKRRH